jgi:hypothetical protein
MVGVALEHATAGACPESSVRPEYSLELFLRVNRTSSGPGIPITNAKPPFRWSDIESTNYLEYITRLRAIGCPEPVIRDLITADINQLYSSRVRATWSPPQFEYWRKTRSTDRPNAA